MPVTNGFNAIANQLDWDGTGTNNNLQTVFGSNALPVGAICYAFTNGGYATSTYLARANGAAAPTLPIIPCNEAGASSLSGLQPVRRMSS